MNSSILINDSPRIRVHHVVTFPSGSFLPVNVEFALETRRERQRNHCCFCLLALWVLFSCESFSFRCVTTVRVCGLVCEKLYFLAIRTRTCICVRRKPFSFVRVRVGEGHPVVVEIVFVCLWLREFAFVLSAASVTFWPPSAAHRRPFHFLPVFASLTAQFTIHHLPFHLVCGPFCLIDGHAISGAAIIELSGFTVVLMPLLRLSSFRPALFLAGL